MKQENPLRKKLLLFDYFLYQWFDKEETISKEMYFSGKLDKIHHFESFLVSISNSTLNRVLWSCCLFSKNALAETGLFETFNSWAAYAHGCIECDVYGNLSNLYCLELFDNMKKGGSFLQSRPAVINEISKITYPDLVKNLVNDKKAFLEYAEKHFPAECLLVKETLSILFDRLNLKEVIISRDRDRLNYLCQGNLWENAFYHTSDKRILLPNNLLFEQNMFIEKIDKPIPQEIVFNKTLRIF